MVEVLQRWSRAQLERVSGKSDLAEAIRYTLRHWTGLILFLEDGRVELDTDIIERAIRPIALGGRIALFAARMAGRATGRSWRAWWRPPSSNGVEPLAWLTDVLERMVSGATKAHELERLLPWHWKADQITAAVGA